MKPTVIVCDVEFSPEGRAVLAMALRLGRWYEAELHVTHLGSRVPAQNKSVHARALDQQLSARLVTFVADVNVEGRKVVTAILQGDPVSALIDYTRSVSGELILVSQNGRRGSSYWSAGTLGKEVGRLAGCPTLTVPDRSTLQAGDDAPFKNIVCGIDFSESSAVALDHALGIAQQAHARLTLLHVLECVPPDVQDLRTKLLALVPPGALDASDVDVAIESGEPRTAIVATAAAHGADLIVIGQPRTTSHRVEMASTGGAVLRHAQCPVLSVPEEPVREEMASRYDAGRSSAMATSAGGLSSTMR